MSKRCCGILYPDTEKVCVKCGEPLVDEPDEAEDAANKDTADEDENSTTVLTDEEMGVKNDPVESENAGKDDAEKNTDAVTNNGSGDGADDGTDNNANDGSEDKKEAKTSDSREHSDILISGGDEKTDVLTGEPGKRKFHGKTVRDGSEYFEEEERIREVTEEEASGKKKGGSVVMKVIGIVSLVALLLFAAGLAYNYYLLFEKNPNPVYEGAAEPTSTGSFGNTFHYKNWDLNFFITYSFGNVVRLDHVFKSRYDDLDATPKEFNNRWTVSGDEYRTNIPAIAARRQNKNDSELAIAYNSYNYSTERIAKGDFIRMKEISLAYSFPKTMINSLGISNLSLKLQATNLFLIYADKKLNGQDPEFFNTGGVAAPTPKQFTLTLRLGL